MVRRSPFCGATRAPGQDGQSQGRGADGGVNCTVSPPVAPGVVAQGSNRPSGKTTNAPFCTSRSCSPSRPPPSAKAPPSTRRWLPLQRCTGLRPAALALVRRQCAHRPLAGFRSSSYAILTCSRGPSGMCSCLRRASREPHYTSPTRFTHEHDVDGLGARVNGELDALRMRENEPVPHRVTVRQDCLFAE